MRLPFYLALSLFLGGCSATVTSDAGQTPIQNTTQAEGPCGGQLSRVAGVEIAAMIVGTRFRFAGSEGVCSGSIWSTSNWEQAYKAGGEVWLQDDRADRNGTYTIKGDELCISAIRGGGCHQLYRDAEGLFYLAGPEIPGPGPAMVLIKP